MARSDTFMLDSTDDDDADVSIARVLLHVVEERTLLHDYYSMLAHPTRCVALNVQAPGGRE